MTEDDGFETIYPVLGRLDVSRETVTTGVLFRMADKLAEEVVAYRLTKEELQGIASRLVEQTLRRMEKREDAE